MPYDTAYNNTAYGAAGRPAARHPRASASQRPQPAWPADAASPRSYADEPHERGAPRWLVGAGIVLIALQLLTFDVVVERHARRAQAQAANHVTVTLQPRPDSGAPAPATLVAGN